MKQSNRSMVLIFSLVISLCAFTSVSANDGSVGCTISGSSTGCANESMNFSRSCSNASSYSWTILWNEEDLIIPKGSASSISHTFTASGTYTVILSYYDNTLGAITNTQKLITIGAAPAVAAVINATGVEFCGTASPTLTIGNPTSGVNYQWQATPGSYSGTGTSITLNGITATTEVTVFARLDGVAGCARTSTQTITMRTTGISPVADAATPYRKRILRGNVTTAAADHFWQSSTTGTEIINSLVTDYTVTGPGPYYIRRRATDGSCWTTASSPIAPTINYTPPQPTLIQVENRGYAEISMQNADLAHILTFADFYW